MAAARGDTARSRHALDSLERLVNPYLRGRHLLEATGLRAALGYGDGAMSTLRRALAAGVPFTAELHALPILQPLATRRDFIELLRPRG